MANYWVKCPEPTKPKEKRKAFVISVYSEELRQEESILHDGVFQMMDARHFRVWMAKPKNGCWEPAQATAKWKELHSAPTAITVGLGPCAEYRERVAVKKADLVTFRDAQHRAKILDAQQKAVKNQTALR